ncbi:MAG TPA: response regulator [Longimicrobiales bacterium]|nr:response regulator [Longimicrobiales bacterium]
MEISGIQHWIVAVVRSASLEGAAELNIPASAGMDGAWSLAALATGIDQDSLAALVARHYRLDVADLEQSDPHASKLLPGRVARRLQVVALRYTDRALHVATADPVAMDAEREISHLAGRTVHFEIAPPGLLAAKVTATYPESGELQHEIPPLRPDAKGGQHVLVVEDDADTRVLLRAALETAGFRVEEAVDGPDALAMLESHGDAFDLVTLDLKLERMHGLEVLKRIRGNVATAEVAVVVATGSDDPAVEMELFQAGADDFVVKPVDPRRFILRVQAVLRRRHGGIPQGHV